MKPKWMPNQTMRMLLMLLTVLLSSLMAQPDWNVNPENFTFQSEMRAELYLDYELTTDPGNIVGVFAGTECRGLAQPVYVFDTWMYFLEIYSDTEGEILTFQAYIASEEVSVNVLETIVFEPDQMYGSPFSPFELNAILHFDNPPELLEIPDQAVNFGEEFLPISLDDYLIELDGDNILWSLIGDANLAIEIDEENIVTLEPLNPD